MGWVKKQLLSSKSQGYMNYMTTLHQVQMIQLNRGSNFPQRKNIHLGMESIY
jgi:hypothetical protein